LGSWFYWAFYVYGSLYGFGTIDVFGSLRRPRNFFRSSWRRFRRYFRTRSGSSRNASKVKQSRIQLTAVRR
jgi:hypothetical protein